LPASQLSLSVTEAYRERLLGLRDSIQALARSTWRAVVIEDLEGTFDQWRTMMTTGVTAAQQEAVRATSGYVTAYLTTELGEPTRGPTLDSTRYVGKTRDGRSVHDGLESPLIGIRLTFKRGGNLEAAFREGLNRAIRMVGEDVMHAGRQSLQDAFVLDERIVGWKRAVRGTCGACAGLADGATSPPGTPLNIHPGCQCVSEAVVKGSPDQYPRPTGQELFLGLTSAQQDAAIGAEAAEKVRSGDISLKDLIAPSPQRKGDDYITQGPV
jgi:hypothetical protein